MRLGLTLPLTLTLTSLTGEGAAEDGRAQPCRVLYVPPILRQVPHHLYLAPIPAAAAAAAAAATPAAAAAAAAVAAASAAAPAAAAAAPAAVAASASTSTSPPAAAVRGRSRKERAATARTRLALRPSEIATLSTASPLLSRSRTAASSVLLQRRRHLSSGSGHVPGAEARAEESMRYHRAPSAAHDVLRSRTCFGLGLASGPGLGFGLGLGLGSRPGLG